MEELSKAADQEAFENSKNHTLCVTEIKSFLSAFLFSLETQHTIGELTFCEGKTICLT
jgi:hypothetical protein